jgi:hypothetical protein
LCIVSPASIINRYISAVETASLFNESIKFMSTLARLASVKLYIFPKPRVNSMFME